MRYFRISLLALFWAGAALADPSYVVLTGTIRDFKGGRASDSHPDFATAGKRDVTGAVRARLNADSKPELDPTKPHPGIQSAESFGQWFRDVEEVNLSTPFSILLNRGADGYYRFTNWAFTPIDGQLFGNSVGEIHNYEFTYEVHAQFVFRKGLYFRVAADDDLFVYVAGRLAIDLGGRHDLKAGAVSFDSLGLREGSTYPISIFYAERGPTGAGFGIKTNIPLEQEGSR